MIEKYELLADNSESTVAAQYESEKTTESKYQSEAELEAVFIKQLQAQKYEYLPIHTEEDLIKNLKTQIERLNNYTFDDSEWAEFFKKHIVGNNTGKDSIAEKTATIQEDEVKYFECRDGVGRNIYLLDKKNIHNNTLQVINQYETDAGNFSNRYDVSVLVNGLPLVHIELKRRGVNIKEAFNQINRYQRESFWSGSGLFEYIQIFVISNGTFTKYYSNTTRNSHIREMQNSSSNTKKTSNSFEFTSWWADAKNNTINDLIDFAKTFFSRHTLLNILTKYCVFTSDRMLLVMRPYQIVATEKIINKINLSINYKTYGSVDAGGFVWHTTGSGKTLTSFKSALLATKIPEIEKVLFVVDRKDLDYQTMKEYDKFQKGAANSNTSTIILQKQLENPDSKIIITTIQKLNYFIKRNKTHPIYNKHVVIIFDECHRSQFGDQHKLITKTFKKYHLFGFTGTPILSENAGSNLQTTAKIFGDNLHTYTIIDAIKDKNVLPFKVEYISTIKAKENIEDIKVRDIDKERALCAPERISHIVDYILKNFNRKTKRNDKSYEFNKLINIKQMASAKNKKDLHEEKLKQRITGFNSIFAVTNIPVAKLYYTEFLRQMNKHPERKLKVAIIYSYAPNEDDNNFDIFDDENPESTDNLDKSSRDFLESAISDYNKIFGTNYDTSSDKFQNYYKDVSLRMKNREIDLLIVVNMFLTGFDATTLNTLWVDKNLKMQGLIQAYSRTNRILNSIKTFGEIVCFRDLSKETEESLALFGNKNASQIVLMKSFNEYYKDGYINDKGEDVKPYTDLIKELKEKYPIGIIITETDQKEFIKLYSTILRLRNILDTFEDFEGNEILTERNLQDYHSMYINLHDTWKNKTDSENINNDVTFEMELVKQTEVNVDYIFALIKKYQDSNQNKDFITDIEKAIDSSITLRSKKDLIMNFINDINADTNIDIDWKEYITKEKNTELDRIIEEEQLNKEETYSFIQNAFTDGFIQEVGIDIDKILPPIPLFTKDNNRSKKRINVIDKLKRFLDRYIDFIPAN